MVAAVHDLQIRLDHRVVERCGKLANTAAVLRHDRAAFVSVGFLPAVGLCAGAERIVCGEGFAGLEHRAVDEPRAFADVVFTRARAGGEVGCRACAEHVFAFQRSAGNGGLRFVYGYFNGRAHAVEQRVRNALGKQSLIHADAHDFVRKDNRAVLLVHGGNARVLRNGVNLRRNLRNTRQQRAHIVAYGQRVRAAVDFHIGLFGFHARVIAGFAEAVRFRKDAVEVCGIGHARKVERIELSVIGQRDGLSRGKVLLGGGKRGLRLIHGHAANRNAVDGNAVAEHGGVGELFKLDALLLQLDAQRFLGGGLCGCFPLQVDKEERKRNQEQRNDAAQYDNHNASALPLLFRSGAAFRIFHSVESEILDGLEHDLGVFLLRLGGRLTRLLPVLLHGFSFLPV